MSSEILALLLSIALFELVWCTVVLLNNMPRYYERWLSKRVHLCVMKFNPSWRVRGGIKRFHHCTDYHASLFGLFVCVGIEKKGVRR